ncbi:MAG TPA: SAM-dependent methyltransferase [Terriglobales bacterium]|nr:SAM-dependent methyltransferase [Terriglobales bacterium]
MSLRQKIVDEIRERGPIPFSRYMELCLYHSELGYYSRPAEQFGKDGDFYTVSDIHAVFGRLLARQFDQMWRVIGCPRRIEIVELGPGRGLFAQDVLDWSENKFPAFFAALGYWLVERSPALRERLEHTLERHFRRGKASLTSLPLDASHPGVSPPEHPVIIFANEFFDALPVEILGPEGELRIAEREGRLVETWVSAPPEQLSFLDRYGVHPQPGERMEIPLMAQRQMAAAAASIERGFLIAIDYGYTRDQQLRGRYGGTLVTYRRHSLGRTPYEAPGEQDITAHVNFTALAAAAEQQGMQVQPLVTSAQFLMGIGEANQFADAFDECRRPEERAKVALQLKHLVAPAGTGETFQVLLASKGVAPDRVASLDGLRLRTGGR